MNKKTKIALAVGGALLVVVLVVVVAKRKKKVSIPEPVSGGGDLLPSPTDPVYVEPGEPKPEPSPKPDPPPPVVPVPEKPSEPDPGNPATSPVKGRYYPVESGDTMYSILAQAGYAAGAERTKAYQCMLNHDRNAWIGQTGYSGSLSLRFNRHFEPNTGYTGRSWAWATEYIAAASPSLKWPLVYVPADGEVSA